MWFWKQDSLSAPKGSANSHWQVEPPPGVPTVFTGQRVIWCMSVLPCGLAYTCTRIRRGLQLVF